MNIIMKCDCLIDSFLFLLTLVLITCFLRKLFGLENFNRGMRTFNYLRVVQRVEVFCIVFVENATLVSSNVSKSRLFVLIIDF